MDELDRIVRALSTCAKFTCSDIVVFTVGWLVTWLVGTILWNPRFKFSWNRRWLGFQARLKSYCYARVNLHVQVGPHYRSCLLPHKKSIKANVNCLFTVLPNGVNNLKGNFCWFFSIIKYATNCYRCTSSSEQLHESAFYQTTHVIIYWQL